MRNTARYSLLAIAIITLSSLFPACKKGENDPFLSLRSRDARLTGTWKLKSFTFTQTSVDVINNRPITSTTIEEYNGTVIITTNNDGTTESEAFSSETTYDKDGTYTTISTDVDGETTTETDYWWWEGADKNKTYIVTEEGRWYVDKLSNKEMVLLREFSRKSTEPNGDEFENNFSGTATFQKQ